jgi:hypothetical protein
MVVIFAGPAAIGAALLVQSHFKGRLATATRAAEPAPQTT